MGDFNRTKPISTLFGYDRGTPIDRYYIEAFLAAKSADIAGRVLEVGEASYSHRFGTGITHQDVLHVADRSKGTIIGDLASADTLPRDAFDCIILTQTLQLVYDVAAAVRQLKRALAPGGTLLVTVPGVSSVDRGEWRASWFWAFTEASAVRLFGEVFREGQVEVEQHGNVYSATCFLQGLAVEEVDRDSLDYCDPAYPLCITICARLNE